MHFQLQDISVADLYQNMIFMSQTNFIYNTILKLGRGHMFVTILHTYIRTYIHLASIDK
jgi:hypothetical protein